MRQEAVSQIRRIQSSLLVATLVLLFAFVGTSNARAATLASIQSEIQTILNGSSSSVQWSVLIENEWGNQTYFSLNPNTPRRPASVTKMFTTAAALEHLGPTYVWRGYQLQSPSTASPVEAVLSSSNNALADELYGIIGGSSTVISRMNAIGINTSGMQVFDGSGLSWNNRFTARQTLDLTRYMMNTYTFNQWATHLTVSCTKGTLGSRICGTDTTGVVHAKTGTLTNGETLSLSGYIDNKYDGQRYFFSIYANSVPSQFQTGTRNRIDNIVRVMAQSGIPNPGQPIPPNTTIVDNNTSGYTETGTWTTSSFGGNYGTPFRFASATSGSHTARWTPNLPKQGIYDVYVWYVAGANRSPSAAYTINHLNGTRTLSGSNGINQQINGSQWVKIGQWEFAAGTSGRVTLDSVASLNGGNSSAVVVADAVRFTLVQETFPEFVVDNTDPGFNVNSTSWFPTTAVPGYLGSNYHARATAAVSDPASWTFTLPSSGNYEVFARWTTGANRATAAPFIIVHNGGTTTVAVNQQQNNGVWVSLGTYNFAAGTAQRVLLSCWTTSGDFVIADGVKLVRK